jgi:hypothetical protein
MTAGIPDHLSQRRADSNASSMRYSAAFSSRFSQHCWDCRNHPSVRQQFRPSCGKHGLTSDQLGPASESAVSSCRPSSTFSVPSRRGMVLSRDAKTSGYWQRLLTWPSFIDRSTRQHTLDLFCRQPSRAGEPGHLPPEGRRPVRGNHRCAAWSQIQQP